MFHRQSWVEGRTHHIHINGRIPAIERRGEIRITVDVVTPPEGHPRKLYRNVMRYLTPGTTQEHSPPGTLRRQVIQKPDGTHIERLEVQVGKGLWRKAKR